jgi:hypothetical protein
MIGNLEATFVAVASEGKPEVETAVGHQLHVVVLVNTHVPSEVRNGVEGVGNVNGGKFGGDCSHGADKDDRFL